MNLNGLSHKIGLCLHPGDMLMVVPPFARLQLPSLAAHLLQACAKEIGIKVTVLYGNLALASVIGELEYKDLCDGSGLPGERVFAHSAYGKALNSLYPSDAPVDAGRHSASDILQMPMPGQTALLSEAERKDLAAEADGFSRLLADCIRSQPYRVVGCSSTFEQTSASISLFNSLKRIAPDIVTIIGGANCEGDMAEGMSALAKSADYVFSGESESTFPEFLRRVLRGELPASRIIEAGSATELAQLPLPDFTEFFQQFGLFLPASDVRPEETWLPYESSRGCWWGEKSHCTFCGLNGETMTHRKKDPAIVFDQISTLLAKYPTKNIFVCDNIMPREYFKTLLPRLEVLTGLNLFYEQKSNLSLANLRALKLAGVNLIQPGIESLSTPLLKLMRKGVSARQHISVLRNARAVGLSMNWNILYDFPGDVAELYEEVLKFLPHIVHFHPPLWLVRLSLDRFSPYYNAPEAFGISNLRAMPAYEEILPSDADVRKVAYHFVGEYESGIRSKPALVDKLLEAVANWKNLWANGGAPPALSVTQINEDTHLLVDSRYHNKTSRYEFLSTEEVLQMLTEKPASTCVRSDYEWILSRNLMLEIDGFFVPLVVGGETALASSGTFDHKLPPPHMSQYLPDANIDAEPLLKADSPRPSLTRRRLIDLRQTESP